MQARIALKGPDEIFALNDTQKQIDKLVERANDMQARVENLENLTSSMAQKEDEKNAVELKAMMGNLKSKFTFLDPASDEQQSKSLSTQVTLMEDRLTKMNQQM